MTDKTNKDNEKEPREGSQYVVIDRRPSFNDDAAVIPEPRYPSLVEELKARAEEAEQRAREISAAYRRIDEERDAFRERLTRDLERRVDHARAELLRKVLGIVDDLDRAIVAARGAYDSAPLLEGVGLIRDRLLGVLASEGVEAFGTTGEPFDPAVAEAILTEETDDASLDNVVLEEMEKGFRLNGKLLRPARVKVARARPGVTTAPSPDTVDQV